MWIITREDLDEMVDTYNDDLIEGEPVMTADEMLGYLDEPVVVEDRDDK